MRNRSGHDDATLRVELVARISEPGTYDTSRFAPNRFGATPASLRVPFHCSWRPPSAIDEAACDPAFDAGDRPPASGIRTSVPHRSPRAGRGPGAPPPRITRAGAVRGRGLVVVQGERPGVGKTDGAEFPWRFLEPMRESSARGGAGPRNDRHPPRAPPPAAPTFAPPRGVMPTSGGLSGDETPSPSGRIGGAPDRAEVGGSVIPPRPSRFAGTGRRAGPHLVFNRKTPASATTPWWVEPRSPAV